jgi:glycosidase
VLLAAGVCACARATTVPTPDTADGGSALCPAEVTYRPPAPGGLRVFAEGAWNGFAPEADELRDDGTGTFRKVLQIPPGEHAYRFRVVGDGQAPRRLDPENPWRATYDGAEMSGLRVADCRRPAVTVLSREVNGAAGRVRMQLRYDARQAGGLASVSAKVRHGGVERPPGEGALVVDGNMLSLSLDGLPRGKHVVTVTATASSGAASEPLLLPVWSEASPFSWDGALLYMVVTDRYRNGDPSNDGAATDASPGAGWHGGDLDGVRASIEDGTLEALGVDALWLTPFLPNPDGTGIAADAVHRVSAYHGYWPMQPSGVDARLGGPGAMRRLVEAAHARGIRVMLDAVANHVHESHPYVSAHPEWFPQLCTCGTPGCDWTAQRTTCRFRPYLPDVDWANGAARARFVEDVLAQVEAFDLDGVRLDAVKHMPDLAVRNLSVRLRERFEQAGTKLFLLGETLMGWDPNAGPDEGGNVDNYGVISRYVGPNDLDGQFDFPLYFAASLAFTGDGAGRGMAHVDYWTRASFERFPAGSVMAPFLGSHDMARFVSLASDPGRANNAWDFLPQRPADAAPYDRMYVASGWLFALPGMPLLYMGDEYGDYGGADPDNRKPWRPRAALSALELRQLDRVSALARARRTLPGLRSRAWRTLLATEDSLVVARGEGSDQVLAVVHRGTAAATLSVQVPPEVAAEGTAYVDALVTGSGPVKVSGGAVKVDVPPWSVRYLRR